MSLTLLSSQPVPIDLDEVKRHLRVEDNEDDETIIALISAAVGIAENYTGIKLLQSQYEYKLPCFSNAIYLPVFPVISIDSIDYVDDAGDPQTLGSYFMHNSQMRPILVPAYGEVWPSVLGGYESVTVTVTVGFVEFPTPIKQAILMLIGSLFENREDHAPVTLKSVPMSSQTLLDPYKVVFV